MPPWHGLPALAIVTAFLFAKRKHWAHPAMLQQHAFLCISVWLGLLLALAIRCLSAVLLLFIAKAGVQNHGATWELLPASTAGAGAPG